MVIFIGISIQIVVGERMHMLKMYCVDLLLTE